MLKTTATTLSELRKDMYKALQVDARKMRRDAKLCVPYQTAEPTPASDFPALMEVNQFIQSAKCRIGHFPKVTKDGKGVRYIRHRTKKGHRSVFTSGVNDRPRPLIFDSQVIGGAKDYWQVLMMGNRLTGTKRFPNFIRFDISKAYLNITSDMIKRSVAIIAGKSGVNVSGRRFLKTSRFLISAYYLPTCPPGTHSVATSQKYNCVSAYTDGNVQ